MRRVKEDEKKRRWRKKRGGRRMVKKMIMKTKRKSECRKERSAHGGERIAIAITENPETKERKMQFTRVRAAARYVIL